MIKDLIVIVRSVGERTENACLDIVQSQLNSEKQAHLVKGKPFSEAHMNSIQIALDSKANWALFLDADVLLRNDALEIIVQEAKKIAEPFFQLNFRILDRGFGGESYGVHFYSTKYFEHALKYKEVAFVAQRPEFAICRELAVHEGIPSITSKISVALHGYQQYYIDLYRTTFVRAIKYSRHLEYMFRLYKEGYIGVENDDFDMRFMFWGLVDGMIYGYEHDTAPLNREFYTEKIHHIYSILNVQEKGEFFIEEGYVESVFNTYKPSALYLQNINWICPSHGYSVKPAERSFSEYINHILGPKIGRIKSAIKILVGK